MSQFDLMFSREFGREEAACDRLRQTLAAHAPIGERQLLFRKSVDLHLPALIELVAVVAVWRILVPAAEAYLKRLAELAADVTWQAVRSHLMQTRAEPIAEIATVLADTASTAATRVEVRFTLRLPGERSGPKLVIDGQDPDTLARCLSNFVVHSERIQQELQAATGDGQRLLGEPRVALADDGGVVLTWVYANGTECRKHII
ncbi:MAG: hypothetical protein OXF33_09370 [Rhodospirillales bacterium]|nr:hypothetical protein [Rhodospirillales bacterium]